MLLLHFTENLLSKSPEACLELVCILEAEVQLYIRSYNLNSHTAKCFLKYPFWLVLNFWCVSTNLLLFTFSRVDFKLLLLLDCISTFFLPRQTSLLNISCNHRMANLIGIFSSSYLNCRKITTLLPSHRERKSFPGKLYATFTCTDTLGHMFMWSMKKSSHCHPSPGV